MTVNRIVVALTLLVCSGTLQAQAQQRDAVAIFREAETAQAVGDVYLAIELYKEAVEVNPNFVDALRGLSEAYFSIAEYSEALIHIRTGREIDRSSMELLTLEGRILLGHGDFQAAEQRFQTALASEPNNLEALFGLAELDVARGRPVSAVERFAAGLRAQPGNVRALLSLVTVYDGIGDSQTAERYVREALTTASGDPLVRYVAARHYYNRDDLQEASHHVELAMEIRPGYTDAIRLAGAISLRSRGYAQAAAYLESLLQNERDDHLLWYALGMAYQKLGRNDDGLNAYARALNLRSDDEIARLTLENLLLSSYPADAEVRKRYANYRFTTAVAYLEKNVSEIALEYFRRGLLLDPRSKTGRTEYARVYRDRGNYAKYLSELGVLVDLGLEDRDILDEIEIYESLLAESVHNDWGRDQFLIERQTHKIKLFSKTQPSHLLHPEADETLLAVLRNALLKYENIAVVGSDEISSRVTQFSDAYKQARGIEADYFIIVDITEGERMVRLDASIYHGETGAKLFDYTTQNTGNGRIDTTVRKLSRTVYSLLPFRARILDRRFGMGLIDAGTLNGLEVDQELLIVEGDAVSKAREKIGFMYDADAVLGTLTVTKTDDLLSEGLIQNSGFFDRINLGDTVLMPPDQQEANPADQLDAEGRVDNPQTDESKTTESEPETSQLYKELLQIP